MCLGFTVVYGKISWPFLTTLLLIVLLLRLLFRLDHHLHAFLEFSVGWLLSDLLDFIWANFDRLRVNLQACRSRRNILKLYLSTTEQSRSHHIFHKADRYDKLLSQVCSESCRNSNTATQLVAQQNKRKRPYQLDNRDR